MSSLTFVFMPLFIDDKFLSVHPDISEPFSRFMSENNCLHKDKNDTGVVWASSTWNSETYFIKIFPEKYFLQNMTITWNWRY
jgi:hypothetical protein